MDEFALADGVVTLRRFTSSDAPTVQTLAGDPAIADTTLHVPHPYLPGEAERWIATHDAGFADGTGATFAVTMPDSGLVGAIGIRIDAQHHNGEIGYWIGKPYWGRGFGTAALRLLIADGFSRFDLHRVCAHHLARNPASGRVMQKAGMKVEGRLREHVLKNGRFEDVILYGLLRSESPAVAT